MTAKQNKAIKDLPTEYEEQVKIVVHVEKKGLLIFAVPNGGKRYLLEAVKLKRSGVRSGVPDIMIPHARKSYHGLFIEVKRERGGIISDSQRYWINALNKEGYLAVICNGFEEAKLVIEDYFNGK